MLLKICLLGCLAALSAAQNVPAAANAAPVAESAQSALAAASQFETAHKHPEAAIYHDAGGFQTAHKISVRATDAADYSMNLLPTKERPELNPVLSALINEDVMKSIEAKRAIELEELEAVRREAEEAAAIAGATEAPLAQLLTTVQPVAAKKMDLDDLDINVGFVDQTINLDAAGTENNKKSRIEIKKGPNGQDYEYEYVYYYEEDDDDSKAKPAAEPAANAEATPEARGKTRYTNIERSTAATPSENSLQSGKAKGRASSVSNVEAAGDDIEAERLPTNTRFPSRGKNIEVQPTPALDSLENAAERKKISVKRPSLELVDSQTFNTDEKQAKGQARNGDNELKPAIAIEQEQAAAAAAAAAEAAAKSAKAVEVEDKDVMAKLDEDEEQTTPSMEKAALDLYAILTNENLMNEQTTETAGDDEATTLLPDTASTDGDDAGLTTLQLEEELSSSTSTSTTTTTTTEAPTTTTTTTTTTAAPSLYGGRRAGLSGLAGRNRFKLHGAGASSTTTSTTEAPSEPTKTGRNRFSRPSIGGRSRPGARTTASPAESSAAPAEEEAPVVAKEVKPVSSSGFGRGRPRNRFNLRGSSTTTEKPAEDSADAADAGGAEEAVSSTTARTLRGRPGLNLRGRSRTTTTKAPASDSADGESNGSAGNNNNEESSKAAAPHSEVVRPASRFNLHRPGGNRLLPRSKLGRAGVSSTEAPKEGPEDSAADSSHHNDVKGEAGAQAGEAGEKTEGDAAAAGGSAANHAGPVSGFNRLKNRPRLNASLHKTDAAKPKASAAPSTSPTVAARKINPLLAKRRLHLGGAAAAATSTTETPADEEGSSSAASAEQAAAKDDAGSDEAADSAAKEQETTEAAETTTKQQARGLGLLGQRRRLPLRKPGTIL